MMWSTRWAPSSAVLVQGCDEVGLSVCAEEWNPARLESVSVMLATKVVVWGVLDVSEVVGAVALGAGPLPVHV